MKPRSEIEAHGEDRENENLGDQGTRVVGDRKRQREQQQQRQQAGDARLRRGRHRSRWRPPVGRDVGVFDAEQALRPDQQHGDHCEIDQKQREARQIGLAEGVGDADEQAADERAAQAAHPADRQ